MEWPINITKAMDRSESSPDVDLSLEDPLSFLDLDSPDLVLSDDSRSVRLRAFLGIASVTVSRSPSLEEHAQPVPIPRAWVSCTRDARDRRHSSTGRARRRGHKLPLIVVGRHVSDPQEGDGDLCGPDDLVTLM